jgi:hypothetical protein
MIYYSLLHINRISLSIDVQNISAPNEFLGSESIIIMTLRDNILYGKVRIGMIELVPEFF